MEEPTYEDYLSENDSWFLIVPAKVPIIWVDEPDEPFDTKDAVSTVTYGSCE